MAYANFIPNVFSAEINRELPKKYVFADNTYQKIAGKISRRGETVTFVGIGKPTIHHIGKENRNNKIPEAETIEDTSVIMPINQLDVFNYGVGDIDRAQATGGLMEVLREETAEALADSVDKYVAKLAVSDDARLLDKTSREIANEADARHVIDDACVDLWSRNIPKSAYIEIIVPPWVYMALKEDLIRIDTNNSGLLRNGVVGFYNKVAIKMSNNCYNDGTDDYLQIRTKRAIGYAKPITKTEAYRPESKFEDAIKGFILYDAKIIRPQELVVAKVHKKA